MVKVLRKLLAISFIVGTHMFAQQPPTMNDFLEAIGRYDQIIITIQRPNKTYEQLSPALGKILGVSLWAYGVYKGVRADDMSKIAMATVAGLTFGASVAAVSKILTDGIYYYKWLSRLYMQEQNIRILAYSLHLHAQDIAQIERSSYHEQTGQMLTELQLELPIAQAMPA